MPKLPLKQSRQQELIRDLLEAWFDKPTVDSYDLLQVAINSYAIDYGNDCHIPF